MTKEEKDLLLKDICSRLSYGVYFMVPGINEPVKLLSINPKRDKPLELDDGHGENSSTYWYLKDVKPYLRPMNSVTEEDVQEIRDRLNNISIGRTITKENFEKCCDFLWFTKMSPFECVSEKMMDVVIDYLDENMFDHRGLIEKGLAIKSPKNVVYL